MKVTIIGGGISGLTTAWTLARQARRRELDVRLEVLEKDLRPGGKVHSERREGYLCEWGPNGFLDSKPMTLELCAQLGITEQLLRSRDAARKRFIFASGRLRQVPATAADFLRSSLVSWPGKLRLAGELLVPPRRDEEDETLAAFVRRRLGREALDKMIAPMASGIFAGDPEAMSLRSCFPRIHQLEQEYGGLIRALLRLARRKRAERRAGKVVSGAAGPGGVLTSFVSGIQYLTDRLAAAQGEAFAPGCPVTAIIPKDGGFELLLDDGSRRETEAVVAAVPAHALAGQVAGMAPAMAALLREIPYAPLQVACCGYRREQLPQLPDAFGFLSVRGEQLHSLGTLWDSNIFPERAPEGRVLMRTMLGGATRPESADLAPARVQAQVRDDLQRVLGRMPAPEFVHIIPHRAAIPQYVSGHGARLQVLEKQAAAFDGLFFTGNAFYGVGLNDCVAAAGRTAEQVLTFVERRRN
jgi:oxygen-dependent protoporphyrinogen oxidase